MYVVSVSSCSDDGRLFQAVDPTHENETFSKLETRAPAFVTSTAGYSYSYSYSYRVFTLKQLFSEESRSVVGLSEKMSFQLRSELSATVER